MFVACGSNCVTLRKRPLISDSASPVSGRPGQVELVSELVSLSLSFSAVAKEQELDAAHDQRRAVDQLLHC